MKYWVELFYFLCIWKTLCFAVGEQVEETIPFDFSEEEYTRFEDQLERIKQEAEINHESQLQQQKELFGNLERKITDLTTKIVGIENKLFDFIRMDSQAQVRPVTLTVDDKISIMNGIQEKLHEQQEQILNNIIDNQNATRKLIKGIEMDSKLLESTMSDNKESLQNMNDKLKAIEDNTIPKIGQLKFYHDIQHQLNSTEVYVRSENHSLSSASLSYPTSCANFNANYCTMNKCFIKNDVYGPAPFLVTCNNIRNGGGGWMVIQRRINGGVDFYRGWEEYKTGFGDLDGEFFIGLDKLHALTSTLKPVELLIQMQDFKNISKYARYNDFQVGNESTNYNLLEVGSFNGNAGDSFSSNKNSNFSTKDRDNGIVVGNCAVLYTGAWWYSSCCQSNLNGKYYHNQRISPPCSGISWSTYHGYDYSLKFVQMLIRPRK